MYYEEKMVDGVMNYRTDPDGEFVPYTIELLSVRYEMNRYDHAAASTVRSELEEQLSLTKTALHGALKAVRVRQEQAATDAMRDIREMVRRWHANTVNEGLRKDSAGILANIDSMINAVLPPNVAAMSCRTK